MLAVAASIAGLFAWRQQQLAREQEKIATEQRGVAQAREMEAMEANRKFKVQLHDASMSDLAAAQVLFKQGSWRRGIAYLDRSLKYEPSNRMTGEWLYSELIYGQGDREEDRPPQLFFSNADIFVNAEARTDFYSETGGFSDAVYSPDGSRFLTLGAGTDVQQWDANTGVRLGPALRHGGYVYSMVYSPDGTRIATACSVRTAQQWDAATGLPIGKPMNHGAEVLSIAYSTDGMQLVTACRNGIVQQWDAGAGRAIGKPIRQQNVALVSAAYSPDGKCIVTACEDRQTRQWDAATSQSIREPISDKNEVLSAVYSPDGRHILTVGSDGTVKQSVALTGKAFGYDMHHENRIGENRAAAAYSSDGLRILTSSSTACQWDAATGELIGEPLRYRNPVASVAFRPDGLRVLVISRDQMVRQWGVVTAKLRPEPVGGHENGAKNISYRRDGLCFLTVAGDRAFQWDATTGKSVGTPLLHTVLLVSAAYSPDGSRIVTAGSSTAWQREAATGELRGERMSHESEVRSAVYSPDGTRIVTACGELVGPKYAQQWDAATGKPIGERIDHKDTVTSAVYSPDGSRILTACEDGMARQWDVATGKSIGEPLLHGKKVRSAIYSHDGRRILTAGDDHTARQWDAVTSRAIGAPLQHDNTVYNASYSPDERRILTACYPAVHQWDVNTGKPIGEPLRYEDSILNAMYSPDGRCILTADGGTVRQWEFDPPAQPVPVWFTGLVQALSGCRFAEDGELLSLSPDECSALRKQVSQELKNPSGQMAGRWSSLGRWLLTPEFERTLTPDNTLTARSLAEKELASGQERAIRHAAMLAPDLPLVHLALAAFEEDADSAAFLREYDARHLPADAAINARAAAMLREQKQPRLALQVLEKGFASMQENPGIDLIASLALTRWLCGDKDAATRDYQRLLIADATYANPAKVQNSALPDGDKVALLATLNETLRLHPELISKARERTITFLIQVHPGSKLVCSIITNVIKGCRTKKNTGSMMKPSTTCRCK